MNNAPRVIESDRINYPNNARNDRSHTYQGLSGDQNYNNPFSGRE